MDAMLRHNRAKLVKKYREVPNAWPDGIESKHDRWYGDGSEWPQDMVELWATVKWLDDQYRVERVTPKVRHVTLKGVTKGPVTPDVTPAVTLEEKQRAKVRERVRKLRAKRLLLKGNPDAR
jgi:hypothetical protein